VDSLHCIEFKELGGFVFFIDSETERSKKAIVL
jgi:hypothetical protein